MSRKSKKNLHITFALLSVASLPLVLLMTYFSLVNIFSMVMKDSTTPIEDIDINSIIEPEYTLNEVLIDTDLKKFPSDYDSLISDLNISLTQHEKTTLLLYGQTISKTEHTNITDAYIELIEKGIPILIPQEYINRYIDSEIQKYKTQITKVVPELEDDISISGTSFRNAYEEYIFSQMGLDLESTTSIPKSTDLDINNFLLDIDSESICEAYYKVRILKSLNENLDTQNILDLLDDIKAYSIDYTEKDAQRRLADEIKDIVLNSELNKVGSIYWMISVIDGISYTYPMYIAQEYVVDDNNFGGEYDVEPLAQSKNSVRVPILMYHHIDSLPTNSSSFTSGLYITPEVFEEHLAYLVKKNYKSTSSQELYNLLREGKNPSQKTVMITFDDSTKGQYTNAYPLLKKYGLTGVFYVVSNRTSITYNQLREMGSNGMIIDSHSATHIDLAKENNPERLYSEIVGSRYTLRGAIGQDVVSISYPGCVADKDVFTYVSQAGYLIGGSCGRSIDHYFRSRLSLSRVHVFNSMENLINILSGKTQ